MNARRYFTVAICVAFSAKAAGRRGSESGPTHGTPADLFSLRTI